MPIDKNKVTTDSIREALKKEGYPFFERGEYNLNFGGIRCSDNRANYFDDLLYCVYKVGDRWICDKFVATVDPGLPWMLNPMDAGGTAAIVEGHYKGLWQYGPPFHGRDCLRQRTPIKIYRDNNRDKVLDLNPKSITEGYYGIFCHESYQSIPDEAEAKEIGLSSAGCVSTARRIDMKVLLQACAKSVAKYGNSISWTLFKESEVC